jgi:hypothetical protein
VNGVTRLRKFAQAASGDSKSQTACRDSTTTTATTGSCCLLRFDPLTDIEAAILMVILGQLVFLFHQPSPIV